MAYLIRPALAEDHAALVEQFQGLNQYEDAITGDRRTDRQGALDALEVAWKQVLETGGHAVVAECDGRVVVHLFLLFREDAVFTRHDLRFFGYISELFVRTEARGAGIGRALMAEAEHLAAARGVRRLAVGVLAGNTPAETLYAALGFVPYASDLVKPLAATLPVRER